MGMTNPTALIDHAAISMAGLDSIVVDSEPSSSSGERQGSPIPRSIDDDHPTQPSVGDRVGRYVLQERLGAGGMGIVHAAWDPELDRRVAIKLIRPGRAISHDVLQRRLRREAQAMARLRHANVVAVYDVGESSSSLFVAMEYVDGISLRKWLRAKSRSVDEVLAVFRAAGEGLAAAHAEGVIHRDFKPDNVLVTRDGHALVLDFGLASWVAAPNSESDGLNRSGSESQPPSSGDSHDPDETSLTKPGAVLGTPNYMAPEQQRGRELDTRSDQYAFCVALWQALSGELPFGRSSPMALARARTGKLGKLRRKDVPTHVEQALRRALAWHPDERFPDMRALLDALASGRTRRRWAIAIPAVLVAAGVGGWISTRDAAPVEASCAELSGRVDDVWNDTRATELGAVFESRGELPRASWPYLRDGIDRWSRGWADVDTELCERYGRAFTPTLRERQLLCLDRALDRFGVTLELLAGASGDELEHAFDLLAGLPDPAGCREPGAARGGVDPQRYAELEAELDRLDLEHRLGRLEHVEAASAELMKATGEPGFEALHVDVAALRSMSLLGLDRNEEAVDMAFAGLAAAERDGDAALRLSAFTTLVEIHVILQDLSSAKRWLAQAQTIATEHPPTREAERDLAKQEAQVVAMGGRLDDGIAAFDRALALTDPEHEPLEHATLLVSRAQLLGWMNQPEPALEQFERGERELVQLIGPSHPTVLKLRQAKAKLHMRLDKWELARTEMLAVAEVTESQSGQPTWLSVTARAQAAWLLDMLGDCQGALAEYEPLLAPAHELLPDPSPDLGEVLTQRSELCDYKAPDAIRYAREAHELYRRAVGESHVMVANSHRRIARIHFENGELEPALEQIELSLAMFEAVAPIGADLVVDAQALRMLIRHALGHQDALADIDEVLAELSPKHNLHPRLAALR